MTTPALECQKLCVGYAGVRIVHDLDLIVEQGEVVALFGPNGAGKTTTLMALSGMLKAQSGSIQINGKPVKGGKPHLAARSGLAFVPDDRSLFYGLSTAQNLKLALPRREAKARLAKVIEYFPALSDLMGRRSGLLSGGEQQMLAVGRALAMQPKVLMVDEMSLGLAPIIVQRLMPVDPPDCGRARHGGPLGRAARRPGAGVVPIAPTSSTAATWSSRGPGRSCAIGATS